MYLINSIEQHVIIDNQTETIEDFQFLHKKKDVDASLEAYSVSHKITPVTIIPSKKKEEMEEDVDLGEIRKSGLSELSAFSENSIVSGNYKKRKNFTSSQELLSHVPQEMTVTKYGYVENRVLSVLEDIMDNGGFLSRKVLNAISIVSMTLEEDGRDINIRYRFKQSGRGELGEDDFSVFRIF